MPIHLILAVKVRYGRLLTFYKDEVPQKHGGDLTFLGRFADVGTRSLKRLPVRISISSKGNCFQLVSKN